jgi:hypothetical protein
VYLDENHSFTVNVPDKLPFIDDEGGNTNDIKDRYKQSDTTCGWLMEQVEMKYANMIKESKQNKQKMTQKIIVTLKTVDQNENIDFWLT